MLIVAGKVPVKADRRAEAVAAALKMAKATQAEAGVQILRLLQRSRRPQHHPHLRGVGETRRR